MATNNFLNAASSWWDSNFVQPTDGAYQGVANATPAYKNSTGVITSNGGAIPVAGGFSPITNIPQTDNWTPLNNNFATPQTANTPFTPSTPFTGSFGNNAAATGIDTSQAFTPLTSNASAANANIDPSIFQAISNHTDGSWLGNTNIDAVGTGNTQQAGFLSGVGDSLSNGWNALGGMEGVSQGLNALSGIGQSYLGFQQLGLAEDQFNFTRNSWQQDYDMRLADYNRQVSRQEDRDAALAR